MNDIWLDAGERLRTESERLIPLCSLPENCGQDYLQTLNALYKKELLLRDALAQHVEAILSGKQIPLSGAEAFFLLHRMNAAMHQLEAMTVPYKDSSVLNQKLEDADRSSILRWLLLDHWEKFAWDWWLKLYSATLVYGDASFYPSL